MLLLYTLLVQNISLALAKSLESEHRCFLYVSDIDVAVYGKK
ncbi:hypothetical protein DSUL_80016 [Desulfovibrionales bacterium]